MGGQVLTVNGDVAAGSAGIKATESVGSVLLSKPGAGTLSGTIDVATTVGNTSCGGTSYTLVAHTGIHAPLTVNCPLDVNGNVMDVSFDLVVQNAGTVRM